jgi:mRNA interferase MazF
VGKPVAGEVVVIPFPQTDLARGKRRPALVLADLPGDDLILCQITRRQRSDGPSIPLDESDLSEANCASKASFVHQRLFTVETALILYSVGNASRSKLAEVLAQTRKLFVPD